MADHPRGSDGVGCSCGWPLDPCSHKHCSDGRCDREAQEHSGLQWVMQEDAEGCAVATIAMLTGRTYKEVRAQIDGEPWHGHNGDWSADGVSHITVDRLLIAHGYYLQRVYSNMVPEWPPPPWSPIHFAQVVQPSGRNHFVVMRADGVVLDPLHPGEHRLTDWPKVNNVVGLLAPASIVNAGKGADRAAA